MSLSFPCIHINGTSKDELMKRLRDACDKMRQAKAAVEATSPNGRDYPLGNLKLAATEHRARLNRLDEVIDELEQVMIRIDNQ